MNQSIMVRNTTEKESIYFKLIAFFSLTDTDVLAQSGRYDRMLAYAMVFRQLVTFVFTFMLFTYGVSLFLGTIAALISGFVFALTLFFLDQAIIGSDWALKNPFKGGLPLRKMFGLIPRIFYSLIIAIGLATLAEISLQANAIDEQIQKDVVENNKEYFARMNAHEVELDTAVNVSEERIIALQQQISATNAEQLAYSEAEKNHDVGTISNSIDHHQVSLEEHQTAQKVIINELSGQNESLSKARKDYQFWFNEAILERTGQDGREPKEGPKYKRAVKTYEELRFLIPIIEAGIASSNARLDVVEEDIILATDKLNESQQTRNILENKESNYLTNQQLLLNYEQELTATQGQLNTLIDDKQTKLQAFRITLQGEGLFYERKTGVLTRYIALQKIHSDPEFGKVATLFSYMLKIFFIAIELMPVIIKLFFSPFSFYSLKMYRKMHVALLQEKALLEIAEMEYKKEKRTREREFKRQTETDNDLENSILI
ncbi:MAG: DUF4407 domain-containing protein [Alcanivoracaceae bacterium]|nr:DUF4407 domain-containing protein [Alcanivoracaceae bacterium]